jgi:predicted transcriptional regulator of viral defense system
MWDQREKERVGVLAGKQHGRVAWHQLVALRIATSTIANWHKDGYLRRVLPKVYAVGHDAPSHEADLVAAVLYAGPGAMLSHASAAHHRALISYAPETIHASTPRSARSVNGWVRVHPERECVRDVYRGIAVTTIPQTLLDLAAAGDLKLLQRAIATLDYRKELHLEAIERACGRGRRGSTRLRAALKDHRPQLAHVNGELEARFFGWCVQWGLPLPRLNVHVQGELVDAYWPQHNLVVELDGYANHSSRAQLHRDRQRDLKLRQAGLNVVRYDWRMLQSEPEQVRNDLDRHLTH